MTINNSDNTIFVDTINGRILNLLIIIYTNLLVFINRVKRVKTVAARRSFAVARCASCNLTAVSLPGSLLGSLPVSLCSTPR